MFHHEILATKCGFQIGITYMPRNQNIDLTAENIPGYDGNMSVALRV